MGATFGEDPAFAARIGLCGNDAAWAKASLKAARALRKTNDKRLKAARGKRAGKLEAKAEETA